MIIGPTEIILVFGASLVWVGVPLVIILHVVRHHRDMQSLKRSVERLERLLEREKGRRDEAPE